MRKGIRFILILATCLFSLYPIYSFAADFPDVPAGHRNYAAVNYLTEKGVIAGYEDGSFLPEREITRTEFCALMSRIMGYSKENYKTVSLPFSDVKSGYWGEDYISFCYEHGLINGMGDGTFLPAAKVTAEQVIKMTVCAVNAESSAKAAGGEKWYSGYVTAAEKLGLLSDASLTVGSNARRGDVAQIVYNAAKSGRMTVYTDGGSNEKPSVSEGNSAASGGANSSNAEENAKSELEKLYAAKNFTDVRTIVIDAGHNYEGRDTGARNEALNIKEEILTWQIADKLRTRLAAMGYNVVMTRKTEQSSIANSSTNESLSARVELAHEKQADLFISIHCNTGGGAGTETYCFSKGGYAARLAELVQKNIKSGTELYDRGVKTAGFYVIKNTLMPAILIETGFIDNASDAAYLTSADGQNALADAVAAAVAEYDKMSPIGG